MVKNENFVPPKILTTSLIENSKSYQNCAEIAQIITLARHEYRVGVFRFKIRS